MAGERGVERRAFAIEAQGQVALGVFLRDSRGEIGGEVETVAGAQPLRTLGKRAPDAAALVAVEGDLDRRGTAFADEPGRDHLGVVADHEVARAQQRRQIGDPAIRQLAQHRDVQETRRLARLARVLGDQLARQRKIEIVETHTRHCPK